jgi:hypothetical protein
VYSNCVRETEQKAYYNDHRVSELNGSLYGNLAYFFLSFPVCCFKTRRDDVALFLTFAAAFKPTANLIDKFTMEQRFNKP